MRYRLVGLVWSLSIILGSFVVGSGAVPLQWSYQALLTSGGSPVTTPVSVTFTVYDAASGGTAIWTETIGMLPDTAGLVSAILGNSTPIDDSIFQDGSRWLGVKIESDPEMTPRTALTSVPYAFRVGSLDGAKSGTIFGELNIDIPADSFKAKGLPCLESRITVRDCDRDATLILDAENTTDDGAAIVMRDHTGVNNRIQMWSERSDGGSQITLRNSTNEGTITLDAQQGTPSEPQGSRLTMDDHNGNRTVILDAENGFNGAGELQLLDPISGSLRARLRGTEGGTDGGVLNLYDRNGVRRIELDAEEGTMPDINLYAADGTTPIIQLDTEWGGPGNPGRIVTPVIEITGGADLSEQFHVNGVDGIEPQRGMLVCIDPDHPGALRVSTQPNDSKVVGVMSGAGGVAPGMLMGQSNSIADGEYPVALTGRVYCMADASSGPIRPGDFLTTSDRPGHAMKTEERDHNAGAIIGKAMTGLDNGQGLVLVLVNLQ